MIVAGRVLHIGHVVFGLDLDELDEKRVEHFLLIRPAEVRLG